MINVENLYYAYDNIEKNKAYTIKDINFSLKNGDILGIIGNTGSGKSTLISMLNGLLTPTKGHIFFNGKNINKDFKNKQNIFFEIGLVFQYPEYQLFEKTVFDDIAFGLRNKGFSESEVLNLVTKSSKIVGISEDMFNKSPLSLSGGEKRRCAIAGIIALNPSVLILDEPTAGLDFKSKKNLLNFIKNYSINEKKITIIVSHNMEEIFEFSSHILMLENGNQVYFGSKKDLFKNENLNKLNLKKPQIYEIMKIIKKRGFNIQKDIFTINQAKKELFKLL